MSDKVRADDRSLTQKTFTGMVWNLLGVGLTALSQILVVTILARLLMPEDFGLVGAALVVVGFSEILSQLGVGPAIVQRSEINPEHLRVAFTLTMILGLGLGICVWCFSSQIASFFHFEGLTLVLRTIAFLFPLRSFSVVSESLLQRDLQFKQIANIEVLSYAVGYGVVGISLAWLDAGVWALVGGVYGQALIRTFCSYALRPFPIRFSLKPIVVAELLRFGLGFTMARIANYSANQGDNIIIGRFLGAEALGLYGRAFQFIAMPASLFGGVVDRVLFPAMAKVQNDRLRLAEAYEKSIAIVASVALPLSFSLIVLAPRLVNVLLGDQWAGVIAPFQVLACGILFRTSYKMSDSLARATGAVYRRAWRQWIYAILVFSGAYLGRFYGVTGVAIGVLFAIVGNYVLMATLSLKITGLSILRFVRAQTSGVYLATCLGILAWLIDGFVGGIISNDFIALLIIGAMLVTAAIFLCRLAPGVFLGEHGQWGVRLISNWLPDRFRGYLNVFLRVRV